MLPVLLAVLATACAPGASTAPPARGILVLAIDALRADHLSCLGYDRRTTPAIDRLARDGVSFEQTFSTAPQMLPAHLSLLTGCDPNIARRAFWLELEMPVGKQYRVPDSVPRLAVELLAAGWATAAFMDHNWMAPVHGLAPGFELFHHVEPERNRPRREKGIEGQAAELLDWLGSLPEDRPWFAYVQLHDLERVWQELDVRWETYFAPRPELGQVLPVADTDPVFFAVPRSRWRGGSSTLGDYEARYDGGLRRLDVRLRKLFEDLQVARRWDGTTIVVVGTFGLCLGEAGLYADHGMLSTADLHVPWIVRPAEGIEYQQGLKAPQLASLVDVAPTLLELAGLARPAGMHGVSQVPVLQGASEPVRDYAFASQGLQEGFAVFGARECLEVTLPGKALSDALRRSWFGDGEPHDAAVRQLYYDRLAEPYPPTSAGQPQVPRGAEALRAVGDRWARNMVDLRTLFHPELGSVPPRRVEELRALGYFPAGFEPPRVEE